MFERLIFVGICCLTLGSCFQPNPSSIISVETDCLIYKGIYAPAGEAKLIPHDVAIQIKQFNAVWESRCLTKQGVF